MLLLNNLLIWPLLCFFHIDGAIGCSCSSRQKELGASIQSASSVFVGTVIQTNDVGDTYEALFKVKALWKGTIEVESRVITSTDICGWNFQVGNTYLIYAFEDSNGQLFTDKCTSTKVLNRISDVEKTIGRGIIIEEHLEDCTYGNSANFGILCSRVLSPVCGCNGITYDNACDARSNGVPSWQTGSCK